MLVFHRLLSRRSGVYLLFELEDEPPGALPAALSLEHTLVVLQHTLACFSGGFLTARVFGKLLHQDVVTWVGVAQDAQRVLGFAQSLQQTTAV